MPTSEREFWAVELLGDDHAIECWEHSLREEGDRYAYVIRHPNCTPPLLRCSDFDAMAHAREILPRARVLVDEINGAIRATRGCDRVNLGNVIEARKDGLVNRTLFAEMFASENRFGPGIVHVDGQTNSSPKPSIAQRWLKAASHNDLASELLMHFGKGKDWYDLYKAYECLRAIWERDNQLQRVIHKPNKGEFRRFTHTANFYRHGADHAARKNPPKVPMAILEADAFIEARLIEAMEHLSE